MGVFGNVQAGDEFIHRINGDMWGSIFEAPEDGYAEEITVCLLCRRKSFVRCALYEEYVENMRKRFRFVMATEQKVVSEGFKGWLTFNFTAPPPVKRGTRYWIVAWADDDGLIFINTRKTEQRVSAEWTSYMAGDPKGLSYPRFYKIVPQSLRIACVCSIYCALYVYEPHKWVCPYCKQTFNNYNEVLQHVESTPTEMIHLQICGICGWTGHLDCQLQQHRFERHSIGAPPVECSCIFCSFKAPAQAGNYREMAAPVYNHIKEKHLPMLEGGELPLSFEKQVKVSTEVTVTVSIKWLLSDTEPETPEGYGRAPELDLDCGVLGKYWAFIKKEY